LARMLLGEDAMDLAIVFDWFAQDSIRGAEQTDEPRKREVLLKPASHGRPPATMPLQSSDTTADGGNL
jgi:hypothetical protein